MLLCWSRPHRVSLYHLHTRIWQIDNIYESRHNHCGLCILTQWRRNANPYSVEINANPYSVEINANPYSVEINANPYSVEINANPYSVEINANPYSVEINANPYSVANPYSAEIFL